MGWQIIVWILRTDEFHNEQKYKYAQKNKSNHPCIQTQISIAGYI